jgi:catechol 2,3-dioxygenase-like lactoylglutathione lyase family enzyme
MMTSTFDPIAYLAPSCSQIGFVVPDIDKAETFFRETYGIPRFFILRDAQVTHQTYLGKASDTHQHVGFAYAGILNVELVQPISGVSTYSTFLRAHPHGGVHHVGLKVPDYGRALEDLTARGHAVVQTGRFGTATRFAYFDTEAAIGVYTEIYYLDPETESLFARIRSNTF